MSAPSCGEAMEAVPVEIYVKGVRYASVLAYHQHKREELKRLKAENTLPLDVMPTPDVKKIESGAEHIAALQQSVKVPPQMRIAGIEPSMTDLVEMFDISKADSNSKEVFSSFELQDFWMEAIKNESGPLLLMADKNKVRLMRLEKKP